MSQPADDRRPIATRELSASKRIASMLARRGISANTISVWSVLFGVLAGVSLAATGCPELSQWQRPAWLLGACLIQLRLLANMLDGMVATETQQSSPLGALYNEVPDRISDIATLVGLGYAAGGSVLLGLWAALLAVLTAYIRAQGVAAGARQCFVGPMAKPQRMFAVTVTAIYCGVAPAAWQPVCPAGGWGVASCALILILIGAALTCVRRTLRIAAELKGRAP